MPRRTSRRAMWMWAIVALIVLGVLLPPYINVNRFRTRVAEAIGHALGREVTVSHIELQLLPRPGLTISNFSVSDDPSYGAEPLLQASTVTALLRLSSLWRGRLEIGTLKLDNPSLNLVRRGDGHWNLEELVQRTEEVPSAPTTTRPEGRPRFPYVKASAGRINFKLGLVKKAFAVTDADFGLWLESDNEWGLRLQGRPTRTDVTLSDAGVVGIEGQFQRAANLRETPVNLRITLQQAQLGGVSKLVFGRDRGWRGGLSSSATVSGTPQALAITLDGEVNDFRRYDIALGEALRLRAHCTGTYSSVEDTLRDMQCESPVANGLVGVSGNVRGWSAEDYDLSISGSQIPMERIMAFARHAKKHLPADLTATGTLDGVFSVRKSDNGEPRWLGGGTVKEVVLRSGVLKNDLELGELQFAIPSSETSGARRQAKARNKAPTRTPARLIVKPFALPLGASSPATATATFDRDRYQINLAGHAELSRLVSVAQAFGVGTPGIGLAGNADLTLSISGTWAGFSAPSPNGKIQVRSATAELQGVAEPLQIAATTATISDQVLNVTSFTAAFVGGPAATGSASFPVHCTSPDTCIVHFDVHTGDLTLSRLNQLVNPGFVNRPWYRLLAVWQRRDDALLKLRGNGQFSAARLSVASLVATNVNGNLALDAGKVRLDVASSELLGGHHTGSWNADFTQSPPKFVGGGKVSKLSMEQLSSLMDDNWATGTVSGQYALSFQGSNAASLRDSADGSATFTWNAGSLPHVTLDGHGTPMTFASFDGTVVLQNGKFNFADCNLQSGMGTFAVKGTASYLRSIDLRLERPGGRSYAITGSLDQPHVESLASPTEARLR